MDEQCQHLILNERERLLHILEKIESMFDGTLDTWKTHPVNLDLKDDATPMCSHDSMFRKEVERIVKLGVLNDANDSELTAPSLVQYKTKTHRVRFLSDFRNLKRQLKRKPYPIPKIREMLLNLAGFQYTTSLYFNIGYYHIRLSNKVITVCTIILPWGKYKYKRLTMGICNSPDIFQEKMKEMFRGFECIRSYR